MRHIDSGIVHDHTRLREWIFFYSTVTLHRSVEVSISSMGGGRRHAPDDRRLRRHAVGILILSSGKGCLPSTGPRRHVHEPRRGHIGVRRLRPRGIYQSCGMSGQGRHVEDAAKRQVCRRGGRPREGQGRDVSRKPIHSPLHALTLLPCGRNQNIRYREWEGVVRNYFCNEGKLSCVASHAACTSCLVGQGPSGQCPEARSSRTIDSRLRKGLFCVSKMSALHCDRPASCRS